MWQAISFAVKAVLIAADRTQDPYRERAYPGGQVFLTPAHGSRLYLRDHLEGSLERFAFLATSPTRDEEYVNLVATVCHSFSAVPLAADPPDGAPGSGPAADLPGPGPAAAADAAPVDPSPLTLFAEPWPTTRQPYAVAQPPFRGRGRPRGHSLPAPAQPHRRSSPRGPPALPSHGPGAGLALRAARAVSSHAARRRGLPAASAPP